MSTQMLCFYNIYYSSCYTSAYELFSFQKFSLILHILPFFAAASRYVTGPFIISKFYAEIYKSVQYIEIHPSKTKKYSIYRNLFSFSHPHISQRILTLSNKYPHVSQHLPTLSNEKVVQPEGDTTFPVFHQMLAMIQYLHICKYIFLFRHCQKYLHIFL